VDILASEYGWAMNYIYDQLYFDEVYSLVDAIKKRRNGNYRMLLAIVQSPHTKDPQLMWKALEADAELGYEDEELDTAGFERLKLITSQNPRIAVKG
jgi:hypothetical protein